MYWSEIGGWSVRAFGLSLVFKAVPGVGLPSLNPTPNFFSFRIKVKKHIQTNFFCVLFRSFVYPLSQTKIPSPLPRKNSWIRSLLAFLPIWKSCIWKKGRNKSTYTHAAFTWLHSHTNPLFEVESKDCTMFIVDIEHWFYVAPPNRLVKQIIAVNIVIKLFCF